VETAIASHDPTLPARTEAARDVLSDPLRVAGSTLGAISRVTRPELDDRDALIERLRRYVAG
jgi:hypothetical protein